MNKFVSAHKFGSLFAIGLVVSFCMVEPAFAQGLEKVNTFLANVIAVLKGASLAVVTIAIIWAGYKYLFKHADVAEVGKILAGGLLIGGAAQLAAYLLG